MTINVGIIEDEKVHANQLAEVLKAWEEINPARVSCSIYASGNNFFSNDIFQYDIVFLDIQLADSKLNGIEIARKLRLMKYNGFIVFLTSYNEYVFDGYSVQALNYLLKPVSLDKIVPCLDVLMESYSSAFYIYQSKNELVKIPYSRIFLFTSNKHYIEIVTQEKTYVQLQSLKNLTKNLPPYFRKCHRTTIVNVKHIRQINKNGIIFPNNYIAPLSKPYVSDIKNAFMTLATGRKIK